MRWSVQKRNILITFSAKQLALQAYKFYLVYGWVANATIMRWSVQKRNILITFSAQYLTLQAYKFYLVYGWVAIDTNDCGRCFKTSADCLLALRKHGLSAVCPCIMSVWLCPSSIVVEYVTQNRKNEGLNPAIGTRSFSGVNLLTLFGNQTIFVQ